MACLSTCITCWLVLASQLCSHTIFHVLVQPVRADLQCWVLIRSSCQARRSTCQSILTWWYAIPRDLIRSSCQHAVRVYQNVHVSTRQICINSRCLCSARESANQHLRPPSQTIDETQPITTRGRTVSPCPRLRYRHACALLSGGMRGRL